jgi:para-aminobenzoate synthetase component I
MQFIMKLIQPWHWRKLPLNQRSGSEIFQTLFLSKKADSASLISGCLPQDMAVLLESPATSSTNLARYSICAGSPRIVDDRSQLWTPPVGEILPFLRDLLNSPKKLEGERGRGGEGEKEFLSSIMGAQPSWDAQKQNLAVNLPPEIPFTGGWLGWLGYDLAWEIEKLPQLNQDALPFPVSCWYEPASFAVLDHQQQILWLAATQADRLDIMQHQLAPKKIEIIQKSSLEKYHKNSDAPNFNLSQNEYEKIVRIAQKYIHAGDIFQTNLSLRFESQTDCDSWSIYRALQQINPSPFASYWQTPWGAIISCSPERLVQLSGKQVDTRPIAGTRPRGLTALQDAELARELIENIKERAEHIMLVDLERNDIGRVCEWGSVKVNEFLTIERYSHVMHLVSNVIGTLRPDCDAIDLIRGVFPGGTITGCPKVRCLEIIEELEPVKRNLFYGSCGYLDWRGNLDLNILIRTLLYAPNSSGKGGIVWGQVGAGIVADSDPEREWQESLHKAQAQLNALKLAEIF